MSTKMPRLTEVFNISEADATTAALEKLFGPGSAIKVVVNGDKVEIQASDEQAAQMIASKLQKAQGPQKGSQISPPGAPSPLHAKMK